MSSYGDSKGYRGPSKGPIQSFLKPVCPWVFPASHASQVLDESMSLATFEIMVDVPGSWHGHQRLLEVQWHEGRKLCLAKKVPGDVSHKMGMPGMFDT